MIYLTFYFFLVRDLSKALFNLVGSIIDKDLSYLNAVDVLVS